MTKTSLSRRISSAMASRKASRMVMLTNSVPSGISGSAATLASGASGALSVFFGAGASLPCAPPFSAGGADSAAFSCFSGASVLRGASAFLPSLIADLSSPSARITAIGVLTATSAVPSGTKILPSVPSSAASTSMVALSVSISAMMSPDLTLSPSCLIHLDRLPFSIVGDRAGINTWIGIERESSTHSLGVDVGVELGRIGLGIVGGELGVFVDGLAHLGVDLLELVFAG